MTTPSRLATTSQLPVPCSSLGALRHSRRRREACGVAFRWLERGKGRGEGARLTERMGWKSGRDTWMFRDGASALVLVCSGLAFHIIKRGPVSSRYRCALSWRVSSTPLYINSLIVSWAAFVLPSPHLVLETSRFAQPQPAKPPLRSHIGIARVASIASRSSNVRFRAAAGSAAAQGA